MKKDICKRAVSLGCVIGMAAVLGGCGTASKSPAEAEEAAATVSEAEESESASDQVTITFQQWWEPELPDGALKGICDAFTEETGVSVELVSSPYAEAQNEIFSTAAQGHMADVVGLDGSWVHDFAKLYSIENLTELMEKYGVDASQLNNQVQVDGQTYMIPVVNFAYPLYVNMDILEAAGVETIPSTWSEFLDALQKVQENTDAAGYALPLQKDNTLGVQHQALAWLWASGGSFLKESGADLVSDELPEKLVELFKTMNEKGYLAADPAELTETEMIQQFENGTLAFMVDSAAHLNTIKETGADLNFTYAALPVMDGYTEQSGADVANWGIGVGTNSSHKQEAMEFIEYLMRPEVNAELARLANAFPGNAEAAPDYSGNDPLFSQAYEIYEKQYPINEFIGLESADKMMRQFRDQMIGLFDGTVSSGREMLEKVQAEWEKEV